MNKHQLIERLKQKGFSEKIIKAFEAVNRENFMPDDLKSFAYEDTAMPIGFGQTISQPYTIAFMLNLLEVENKKNQKILEIGSGSGYVLALLSHINQNGKIFGIERLKELVDLSKLKLNNYKNVKVICGNGLDILKKEDLFDKILVSAAANKIPEKLIKNLKREGIMVIPVKNSIFYIKKLDNNKKLEIKEYPGFVFVPLIDNKI